MREKKDKSTLFVERGGEIRFDVEPVRPTLLGALIDLSASLQSRGETLHIKEDEVLIYEPNGDWVWQFNI